jgi:hypothetical protein
VILEHGVVAPLVDLAHAVSTAPIRRLLGGVINEY